MEKLETRLNFYYIDVSNYIVANAADTFHSTSTYGYNLNEMIFYGVEMEFNSHWSDRLTFFGNYTYRKTSYDDKDLLAKAILLDIAPEHKANLGVRYGLWAKTLATTDIRYVGKRESEGDVYTLDDFVTVDVGLEYRIRENFTAHVFVGNVLDEDYQEIYGYPMPGRVYGVSLKATF